MSESKIRVLVYPEKIVDQVEEESEKLKTEYKEIELFQFVPAEPFTLEKFTLPAEQRYWPGIASAGIVQAESKKEVLDTIEMFLPSQDSPWLCWPRTIITDVAPEIDLKKAEGDLAVLSPSVNSALKALSQFMERLSLILTRAYSHIGARGPICPSCGTPVVIIKESFLEGWRIICPKCGTLKMDFTAQSYQNAITEIVKYELNQLVEKDGGTEQAFPFFCQYQELNFLVSVMNY